MVEARTRLVVLALLGLAVAAGCKRATQSRVPRRDVAGMDVAQIERELALNRADLEAAGIFVPAPTSASPPSVEAGPSAPPEPSSPDPGAVEPTTDDAVVEEAEAVPPSAAPRDEERGYARITSQTRRSSGERRKDERDANDRCARICELAEVTCDLQDQICALAARHAHDVRYEAACERSELQCDAAARECQLCTAG